MTANAILQLDRPGLCMVLDMLCLWRVMMNSGYITNADLWNSKLRIFWVARGYLAGTKIHWTGLCLYFFEKILPKKKTMFYNMHTLCEIL